MKDPAGHYARNCKRLCAKCGKSRSRGTKSLCRKCYSGRAKTAFTRFWEKVKVAGPNECWIWTGGLSASGYGLISPRSGRQMRAHRFSYELHHAVEITDHLMVRHSCDNPPCVNPAHLLLGTAKDNALDAVTRGRNVRGEKSGQAKITSIKAKEIVRAALMGVSLNCLSVLTDLHTVTIQDIVRGKIWKEETKCLVELRKTMKRPLFVGSRIIAPSLDLIDMNILPAEIERTSELDSGAGKSIARFAGST